MLEAWEKHDFPWHISFHKDIVEVMNNCALAEQWPYVIGKSSGVKKTSLNEENDLLMCINMFKRIHEQDCYGHMNFNETNEWDSNVASVSQAIRFAFCTTGQKSFSKSE